MSNRREFIKNLGLVVAGASFVTLSSGFRKKGPNDLINIGIIGTGSHCMQRNLPHYLKYNELCKVVAVCDVSMSRAASAKELVDKTYKTSDCIIYQDFRQLLDNKSIDAVQITTPDHWHVPISIMAALKGKHVCCEKPTLTIAEGRLLCDVIKKTGVTYQVSVEDRCEKIYHKMAEIVLNGRIGALKHIEIASPMGWLPDNKKEMEETTPPPDLDFNLWLGPAPEIAYIPARTFIGFRYYNAFSGGIVVDWGAHLCDTAQLVTGTDFSGPVEVTPAGDTVFHNDGVFNTAWQFDLNYKYANNVTMRFTDTSKLPENQKIGPFPGANIRIEGEEGWIESIGWLAEIHASNNKILDLNGKRVNLPTSADEILNFLESIKTGNKSIYSPEIGHRTSSLLHLGNIALKLNRKVGWDPRLESFINDPEAEKLRKRQMREPWSYAEICPGYKY